jgi:hypothetical protein
MSNSYLILASGLFLLVSACSEPYSGSDESALPAPEAAAPEAFTPAPPEAFTPAPSNEFGENGGGQWSYHQSDDEMGNGTTYVARVSSSNTVNFGFPYSGDQHAELQLRTHPRYGKDVIFSIEKGQFLCNSFEDCIVLVRFDDGKATSFSAAGAADNSTETIFIRNYSRFVEKMQNSKRVRISANIYQEGAPVFEFDVSEFDQKKYKQKKI